MEENNFKVLIVGASVTGLALANMLEKAGIDYLVLEGGHEIAPQVGASIGVFPHGLRILDQLGCADSAVSLMDQLLENSMIHRPDGSLLRQVTGVQVSSKQRWAESIHDDIPLR